MTEQTPPEEATERIAITPTAKARLDELRLNRRETYGDIVDRLLSLAESQKVKA